MDDRDLPTLNKNDFAARSTDSAALIFVVNEFVRLAMGCLSPEANGSPSA